MAWQILQNNDYLRIFKYKFVYSFDFFYNVVYYTIRGGLTGQNKTDRNSTIDGFYLLH